jgi:hypothetical protein
MTRRGVTVLVGLLALASCGTAVAQTEDGDGYVNGQKGTYRGRVLDAGTSHPLAGVVVVAVWRRDRVVPLGNRSEHYAAREALTNENGDWLIEAHDLESSAPRRTRRPTFTFLLPGYGRPREVAGTPPSLPWTFYEGAGHTVEMARLNSKDERRDYLFSVDPYLLSETPFTEIPEFTRLFNQERVSLGLRPYPSSGRQR